MPRRKIGRKKPPHKRNGRRGKARHGRMDRIQTLRVRSPGVVCPDRTMVKLKWLDINNQQIGTVGANYGGVQYSANDAHGLAPMGFAEMAALYRYYRVRAVAIDVKGANMEAFPVQVFITPTNTLYTTGYTHGQQLYQNAFTRSWMVGAKGGQDRFHLKNFISTRKMVGTNAVEFDDSYAALTTATPNNLWYYYFYALPVLGIDTWTATNGVYITARLTFYIEFYERNILTA